MNGFELVPPGYFVQECPEEIESGFFECPYLDCGGRTFITVDECISHHLNWHSGPYKCPECSATFASKPTLDRHSRASEHSRVWKCLEKSCESLGVGFATEKSFQEHVAYSPYHKSLETTTPEASDAAFQNDSSTENDNEPSHVCREPACSKYDVDFEYQSKLKVHQKSAAHSLAVEHGRNILLECSSPEELESKRMKMRNLVCFYDGCFLKGNLFSTTKQYFSHLASHEPLSSDTTDAESGEKEERPRCLKEGCPKFGHRFSHLSNYACHEKSAKHINAQPPQEVVEKGPAVKRKRPAPPPAAQIRFSGLLSPETPTNMTLPDSPESPLARKGQIRIILAPKKIGLKRPAPISIMKPPAGQMDERMDRIEGRINALEDELRRTRNDHERQIQELMEKLQLSRGMRRGKGEDCDDLPTFM